MAKRKSTKEVIESTKKPEVEHGFIKYPRKEPVELTDYSLTSEEELKHDNRKFSDYKLINDNKPYTHIHTHPTELSESSRNSFVNGNAKINADAPNNLKYMNALPSEGDVRTLIVDGNMKTMAIAVRDSKTGDVLGYQVIKKTERTPSWGTSHHDFDKHPVRTILEILNANYLRVGKKHRELRRDLLKYQEARVEALNTGAYEHATEVFEDISNKYGLKHRLVSAREFEPSKTKSAFVKKNLEHLAGATTAILILGSFFFLSSNLTGNVIGSLNQTSSNWIGAGLFLIGLIGAFVYFRRM